MSSRYKAIIVEDEQLARDRLRKLLLPHADRIEIIGLATDGEEGLVMTESLKPHIIFLDVQMPIMSGFEMLQKLSYKPRIIFTTAYDQYAIRAFEENSIDYLLKPVEEERLKQSLRKLDDLRNTDQNAEIHHLLKKLERADLKTITVSLGDRVILIRLEDIVYFHAEDKYVIIHDIHGKKHLLSTSLKELEETLGSSFIRIHRAYIINREYVKEIHKSLNGKLTFLMSDPAKSKITSSHSYTPMVRKSFQM